MLERIKRLKKRVFEELNAKYSLSQKLESVEKMIIDLKIQLEEAKRIEEFLTERLLSKDKDYEKLEVEIVSLSKVLDKVNLQLQLKFGKSIETLDQILGCQKSLHVKTSIGFDDQKNKVSRTTNEAY